MNINTIIKNEIYPFDLMVSFNETDKKFKSKLKSFDIDLDDACLSLDSSKFERGRAVLTQSNQLILRLNFYPKTPEQLGMLAHEIFHIVEFLLEHINIKLSKKTDEVYAYMIGFYTKKIFEILKKDETTT